jgi:hypothetical protein
VAIPLGLGHRIMPCAPRGFAARSDWTRCYHGASTRRKSTPSIRNSIWPRRLGTQLGSKASATKSTPCDAEQRLALDQGLPDPRHRLLRGHYRSSIHTIASLFSPCGEVRKRSAGQFGGRDCTVRGNDHNVLHQMEEPRGDRGDSLSPAPRALPGHRARRTAR